MKPRGIWRIIAPTDLPHKKGHTDVRPFIIGL